MWSNIEQTIIQCFQNIYSYRNIYITCSQMYDLLIKIDWIIMCLLLYSDLFSGSVFFLKHKNPSFVQKRLNWTNRCCKMFHILSCYYITIHCSNFKIWQWCILAGQSISVFSWVDRNTWLTKTRHGNANDVKIIVPGWNCGTVSTMPVTISMLVLKRVSIRLN